MNSFDINKRFAVLLEEKFGTKKDIVNALSEALNLDKKSIYRRLSSEVHFSFWEICNISRLFGISVDNFIKKCYPDGLYNGHLNLIIKNDDINLTLTAIAEITDYIKMIAGQDYSEFGSISNYFPLYFHFHNRELYLLYQYYILFQGGYTKPFARFREEENAQRLADAMHELASESMKMTRHYVIMGREPVAKLMKDISYMQRLNLLSQEEYDKVKSELKMLINWLEDIVESGRLGSRNSACDIYLSDTVIDQNCAYLWSQQYSLSLSQQYGLGMITSYDDDRNLNMRNWLERLRNNSVLITGSSRDERISFFEEQRRTLDNY